MAIKSDKWIEKMACNYGMIEPFELMQTRIGKISYGLSSFGYDIRVADEYKIFALANGLIEKEGQTLTEENPE